MRSASWRIIFVVLLFATGQWMRVVPTSWDVFPNALSAVLQYASLNRPVETGWVNYNSLQLLTDFIAAPLVLITGLRTSGALNNLNHMYAARGDGSWVGFWIFAASLVVMIGAWFLARPIFLRPMASLTGSVTRR